MSTRCDGAERKVYVIHFEAGDELVIRHVYAYDVDDAVEYAEKNKPHVFDVDEDLWKVDFVGPARAMLIPIAGDDQVLKTIFFTRDGTR